MFLFLVIFALLLLLLVSYIRRLKKGSEGYIKLGNQFIKQSILYSHENAKYKGIIEKLGFFKFSIQEYEELKSDTARIRYSLKLRKLFFKLERQFKHCYCLQIPEDTPKSVVDRSNACRDCKGECKKCEFYY